MSYIGREETSLVFQPSIFKGFLAASFSEDTQSTQLRLFVDFPEQISIWPMKLENRIGKESRLPLPIFQVRAGYVSMGNSESSEASNGNHKQMHPNFRSCLNLPDNIRSIFRKLEALFSN